MLKQLLKMREDLVNASASMAGELRPLARQKVGVLIDEGENILKSEFEESEKALVAQKIIELQNNLEKLEQLAQERISEAKNMLVKIQKQVFFKLSNYKYIFSFNHLMFGLVNMRSHLYPEIIGSVMIQKVVMIL